MRKYHHYIRGKDNNKNGSNHKVNGKGVFYMRMLVLVLFFNFSSRTSSFGQQFTRFIYAYLEYCWHVGYNYLGRTYNFSCSFFLGFSNENPISITSSFSFNCLSVAFGIRAICITLHAFHRQDTYFS